MRCTQWVKNTRFIYKKNISECRVQGIDKNFPISPIFGHSSRLCSSSPQWPLAPNFPPGQLENLRISIDIMCWAPWISQVQRTGLSSFFLRAQPCVYKVYWSFSVRQSGLTETKPVKNDWHIKLANYAFFYIYKSYTENSSRNACTRDQ